MENLLFLGVPILKHIRVNMLTLTDSGYIHTSGKPLCSSKSLTFAVQLEILGSISTSFLGNLFKVCNIQLLDFELCRFNQYLTILTFRPI